MKKLARKIVPSRYHRWLYEAYWWARLNSVAVAVKRLIHHGREAYCPCCRSRVRRFVAFRRKGAPPRPWAQCPVCTSLERHRLVALYLREKTDYFDGRPRRVLHVAPEPQMRWLLLSAGGVDYLSADLVYPLAMRRMDLTKMPCADDEFDIIYCSHVLEHIPDDRAAMKELFRTLKPGGWAIVQVPIRDGETLEDPSVVTPEQRELVFGHHDHVRYYGKDFKDRLGEAGFAVTVDPFVKTLPPEEVRRLGLVPDEDIHFAAKPARTAPR